MLPIQVLTRHEAGVNCLAVYGNLVFTGSEDKDIKVSLTMLEMFLVSSQENQVFVVLFLGVQVF
jgi:E3 ubiquitin-protein ligase TRAF7